MHRLLGFRSSRLGLQRGEQDGMHHTVGVTTNRTRKMRVVLVRKSVVPVKRLRRKIRIRVRVPKQIHIVIILFFLCFVLLGELHCSQREMIDDFANAGLVRIVHVVQRRVQRKARRRIHFVAKLYRAKGFHKEKQNKKTVALSLLSHLGT
jgi:cytochrome b561